jgi:hypothetical protein
MRLTRIPLRTALSFGSAAAVGVFLAVASHALSWSHSTTVVVGVALVVVLVAFATPLMLLPFETGIRRSLRPRRHRAPAVPLAEQREYRPPEPSSRLAAVFISSASEVIGSNAKEDTLAAVANLVKIQLAESEHVLIMRAPLPELLNMNASEREYVEQLGITDVAVAARKAVQDTAVNDARDHWDGLRLVAAASQ